MNRQDFLQTDKEIHTTESKEMETSLEEQLKHQNRAIAKIGRLLLAGLNNKPLKIWLLLILQIGTLNAQTVEWTWVEGDTTNLSACHYGTKGLANSLNRPSVRDHASQIEDENGNLWLFGGNGYDGTGNLGWLNDLWKWDGSYWTWMAGDSILGSKGVYGTLNVSDSSNAPGSRINSQLSRIGSDIYLFGGRGLTISGGGWLNDLWKWDGSTWTWVAGSDSPGAKSIFGTKGQADDLNSPSSRFKFSMVKNGDDAFFLFGGIGKDANDNIGTLNDLWKWDGENWTWLSGDTVRNSSGSFGTLGVTSSTNCPNGLSHTSMCILANGDVVLFGGVASSSRFSNKLWKWDGNNWTWINGDVGYDKPTIYNTKGQTSPSSTPGSRLFGAMWADNYGNLFLLGGLNKSFRSKNDLWKWDGENWQWLSGNTGSNISGWFGTKNLYQDLNTVPSNQETEFGIMNKNINGRVHVYVGPSFWDCNLIYKIEHGGYTTETRQELTISSSTNSGDALQDDGDEINFTNLNKNFQPAVADLPANSNVAYRIKRNWRVFINDVNSNGGHLSFKFDLDSHYVPFRSYYLLERATKSGDFSVVNTADFKVQGRSVIFETDLDELTDGYYYTIGWSDKGAGYALNFDPSSSSDRVELPALHDPGSGSFSVETWFKVNSLGTSQVLVGQLNGTGVARNLLFLNSVGKIRSKLGDVVTSTNELISAGKWYHGAMTYDGSTVKVYLNGILVASESTTAEDCDGSWLLGISSAYTLPFDGEMDELRVWDTVRTEKQLQQFMYRSLRGNEPGLQAYYRFDRHEEDYLPDASKQSNGGVLQNFALTGSTSNWVTSTAPLVDSSLTRALSGPGYALDFDGTDDYVELDTIISRNDSSWTLEIWVKLNNSSYNSILGYQLNSTGQGLFYTNRYGFYSANGWLVSYSTVEVDKWYHLATTYDRGNWKLYVDGLLVDTYFEIINHDITTLYLGKEGASQTSLLLDGMVDELRVWKTTRTSTEIQDNMYQSLEGNETGLAHYYNFDQISGWALKDQAGSVDGTLNNFSTNTCWLSSANREPFKTLKAGSHNLNSTWKDGVAPSSSSDRMAIYHDITLALAGSYNQLHVNSGVSVTTDADVNISGNVIVNGNLLGNNKIVLNGSSKQCLGGSGTIGNLQVNNANDISLEGDLALNGSLSLTDGDIEINNHTLTLTGTTSHGSANSYLKLNGDGRVKATVGSSPVILPIGRNPYLPIIIDDGGGVEFTVGVADGVYSDPTTNITELTNEVVSETWSIQASSAVNEVTVEIGWDAGQESNLTRTACGIGYWENGVSSVWQKPDNTTAATGSDPYFQSRTMDFSTNLYYFGVGGPSSPLPVELIYFTAHWQEQGKIAQLTWQTAIEENNSHFEIERSFDGSEWEQIGRIEGAGNSILTKVYYYIDKSPSLAEGTLGMGQTIYYRLKQIDYNGDFEYSPTRTLNFKLETRNFKLYPNPTTGQVIISTDMQLQEVKIYNLQGKLMLTGNGIQLDVSTLPAGQYILEANDGFGLYREKILKQ